MEYKEKLEDLLRWANSRYELYMTFVSGDAEIDYAKRMLCLQFIKKIKSYL